MIRRLLERLFGYPCGFCGRRIREANFDAHNRFTHNWKVPQ